MYGTVGPLLPYVVDPAVGLTADNLQALRAWVQETDDGQLAVAARPGQHLDNQPGDEIGVRLARLGAVLTHGGDVGQKRAEPVGQGRIQGRRQAGPACPGREERETARAPP